MLRASDVIDCRNPRRDAGWSWMDGSNRAQIPKLQLSYQPRAHKLY